MPSKLKQLIVPAKPAPPTVRKVLYEFQSPEFLQYERGTGWYVGAGVFTLALVALGIVLHSLSLVVAFLLAVAVYFLIHQHQPQLITVQITPDGIYHGRDFYAFGEMQNYWLVLQPPYVADFKLRLKRIWHPIRTIHIYGQDPAQLQAVLAPYLTELPDQTESFPDLLIRAMRL